MFLEFSTLDTINFSCAMYEFYFMFEKYLLTHTYTFRCKHESLSFADDKFLVHSS